MKFALYWNYATRSLRRGGQRTVLAIFCIAVGVMAIVALQLASLMVSNNLTSNVRSANGGDISARSDVIPFQQGDASYFAHLVSSNNVAAATGVANDRGTAYADNQTYPVVIGVVDPTQYPLAGQPKFADPAHGDLRQLLSSPSHIAVSTDVAAALHAAVGAHIVLSGGNGRTLSGTLSAIFFTSSFSGSADVFVSRARFASSVSVPLGYNVFYLTTSSDAQANATAALIRKQYPLSTVQTVADALKQRQQQTTQVHQFLEITGILALLIGGFGVVNTMNVLLARRRIEIAMLKTSGYQRGDLYALFGLEAALLGLAGGVLGAILGTVLSYGVKTLIENAFELQLPFVVDPFSVGMGVIVGLATAIIFGLQPIVRAAFIRPQAVLRESPESGGWGARLGSAALFLVLSVLFCILASIILESALLGVIVVYGTFIALGILGLVFGAIIWALSKMPIPEGMSPLSVVAALVSMAIAGAAFGPLGLFPVGLLFLLIALAFIGLPLLPRAAKATVKFALRDIGRQRTRVTMTMLALFVGVFCVGLMVILGQDVRQKIQDALANLTSYNVVTIAPAQAANAVDHQLPHLSGLTTHDVVNAAQARPLDVNGQTLASYIGSDATGTTVGTGSRRRRGAGGLGRNGTLFYLSGLTGYRVGSQSTGATIPAGLGRNLTRADEGTTNVLAPSLLHDIGPLHLKVRDTLTMANQTGGAPFTLHIVGFYAANAFGELRYPILASHALVHRFAGSSEQLIYTLRIDPNKANAAVARLNRDAPGTITINLTSLGAIVDQVLGNLIILLVALASLALFAGIIIIANAVALAMLERRREQGILKSVGYTSRRVLGGVLIENGLIGSLGGIMGMVVVAVVTTVLARTLFQTDLAIPTPTTLALIALVTVIALLTSGLVAWNAVRVRPLEVLRYE